MTKNTQLNNNNSDYVAMAAKSALGAVPFIGNLLAEIAGEIIPNQRIDRLVKYAHTLQEKLNNIEKSILIQKLQNEEFTDLIEESLRQASRSLSNIRRDYLSSIIVNNINDVDIKEHESKHILRILKDLNDIEIIWLRSFLVNLVTGDEMFRDKHSNILKQLPTDLSSSQKVIYKSTIQGSYKEHLASIGLLERQIALDTSGAYAHLNTVGYKITSLGKLLLRQIGFNHELL